MAEVAVGLAISEQTIYSWRCQDRVDRGVEVGVSTAGQAALMAARKRNWELKTELAVHRRATELLKGESGPKGSLRV